MVVRRRRRLGARRTTGLAGGEIAALASGPAGVAALITIDGSRSAVAVTHDGRSWQGAPLPAGDVPFAYGLVATPDGFLLIGSIESFDAQGGMTEVPAAWRSPDGLEWALDPALAEQLTKGEGNYIPGRSPRRAPSVGAATSAGTGLCC